MSKQFGVPLAALLTPRTADGSIDVEGVSRNVEFVLARGVRGVVVAGATGEYVALSEPARKTLLEETASAVRGRAQLLSSVGAADLSVCVRLADHAFATGVDAVLLPPPHFYQHTERDLEAFYREAAEAIGGPILLYNLPAFTSPIEPGLALRLIESVPNIIGIKDSSGKLDMLQALVTRRDLHAHAILGHDRVLLDALEVGCMETVISGPAGVIPELIVGICETHARGSRQQLEALGKLLYEFLDNLEQFPYPVSLQLSGQARGLFTARYCLPLSTERQKQAEEYQQWFERFWARCEQIIEATTGSGS